MEAFDLSFLAAYVQPTPLEEARAAAAAALGDVVAARGGPVPGCQCRLNIDPPCRSNIDPGRVADF